MGRPVPGSSLSSPACIDCACRGTTRSIRSRTCSPCSIARPREGGHMALIRWWPTPSIVVVDVRQSLGDIVTLGVAAPGRWIVLERNEPWRAQPYFYAFVLDELQDALRQRPQARTLTALEALDLHETGESRAVPAGAMSTDEPAPTDPAYPSAARVVTLTLSGRPIEIGQLFEGHRGRRAAPPPAAT